MKKLFLLIVLLTLVGTVVALDLPLGETKTNSFLENVPDILDSPKISSVLKQEAQRLGEGSIPIIVLFKEKLTKQQKSDLLDYTDNLKYEYSLIPAAAFSVNILELDKLAELAFVKSIELDAETKISLAQSTTQIGATRVWLSYNVQGEGVKVAILDTGIDNEHPDLKNVVKEQDFTGEGTDDEQGHGTHVASTVAGSGAASGGLNKGVASKAELFDVKVLDKTGSGKLSDTIAGIEWSVLNEADIISMSLGTDIPCNGLDAASLASDAAVKRGVHVVVAAGNTGPLPGTVGSPGCARDVITVGAVDKLDNMAVFSSRGPTLDGRNKPDIVAPGVLIIAAKAGGGYTALSGTSMATPHISGVVALLLSEKPELLPNQVKDILMRTAKDLGEDVNAQGAGRVQAYEAFVEATGVEPEEPSNDNNNEESDKKEAEEKSKNEGHIDEVRRVEEKKKDNKDYYVVEGNKKEEPYTIIRVWVNKDTKEIDLVEEISYLKRLMLYIVELLEKIWLALVTN